MNDADEIWPEEEIEMAEMYVNGRNADVEVMKMDDDQDPEHEEEKTDGLKEMNNE